MIGILKMCKKYIDNISRYRGYCPKIFIYLKMCKKYIDNISRYRGYYPHDFYLFKNREKLH